MNSFNHYSFGSVGAWLLTRAAGIDRRPDGTFVIAPHPDQTGSITRASGYVDTPEGRVTSAWQADADGVTFTVDVPGGVSAEFRYPGSEATVPLDEGITTLRFNHTL